MKRLFLIMSCSLLATSCSKSVLAPDNNQYDYSYIADKGHDVAVYNAATFCFASDYVKHNDTLHIILYAPIDSNALHIHLNEVYFDPITGLVPGAIEDSLPHDRNYWFIKQFIKLSVKNL